MKEIACGKVSEELFGTISNLRIVMLKLDKIESVFSYLKNDWNILKEKENCDVRSGDDLKKLGNVSMLKKIIMQLTVTTQSHLQFTGKFIKTASKKKSYQLWSTLYRYWSQSG